MMEDYARFDRTTQRKIKEMIYKAFSEPSEENKRRIVEAARIYHTKMYHAKSTISEYVN
ncbi:hypothetical protein HZA99_01105 [Candidatus Woesearchaeota archaeon]|nr:hypothetical protein [Candidatus Woesearchaeota archaeon]